MFERFEILLITLVLFFVFYLVISLGAGKKKQTHEIARYLFGVRALLIILAIVAFFLWIIAFFNYN